MGQSAPQKIEKDTEDQLARSCAVVHRPLKSAPIQIHSLYSLLEIRIAIMNPFQDILIEE